MTLAGVELACELTRTGEHLTISYQLINRGATDVAVLDRVGSRQIDGTTRYDPDTVFVGYDGETLELTKGTLPIPPGQFPLVHASTEASSLVAGGAHRNTFSLPIPVRVCHPFQCMRLDGEVRAERRAFAKVVTVVVGVVPLATHRVLVATHPAFPEVRSVVPVEDVHREQVLLTQRFRLSEELPVLAYESFPWP